MDIEQELDRINDRLLEISSGYSALRLLMEHGFAAEHAQQREVFIAMVDRLISATRSAAKASEPMSAEELQEQAARVVVHLQRFQASTLERMDRL